jgi:hypothetical protein
VSTRRHSSSRRSPALNTTATAGLPTSNLHDPPLHDRRDFTIRTLGWRPD